MADLLARYRGCLLGGAVGDALGAPVEFLSLAEIRAQFGPGGIRDYAPAYGLVGAITDDTQMTLFTAEGLLRSHNRAIQKGITHTPTIVYHAYLRWLETQGENPHYPFPEVRGGWLLGLAPLHQRRAPGNTCLAALRGTHPGTTGVPLNTSKGCGGVMRAAPVGLAVRQPFAESFELGCETAALTHGHPSGFLAAGFLAATIAAVLAGQSLEGAIAAARALLIVQPGHEECLAAVDAAVQLAREAPATPATVARLGQGWVAEEALAIALFCALAAEDFAAGVILAVNHSGDSDSTSAITGNLLGALLGEGVLPASWLDRLELRAEIGTLADDLYRHFGGAEGTAQTTLADDTADWEKYPGW
jgi:ADP-ribosylglycohydrolase